MSFMRLFPIFAVAMLAACAGDYARYAEEPSFQTGYGDGCVTATEADKSFSTRRQRDDDAFADDRAYAAGWRQGFLQCGGNERSPNDGGRVLGEENERMR